MKDIHNHMIKRTSGIAGLILLTIALSHCSGPTTTPTLCSTTNTAFQQVYASVAALPGHVDTVTYDTEIHAYRFSLSQAKTICKVGYQSQPAISSVPYKIEILDPSNTIIYSGNHVFSSVATSYDSITPTPIAANQVYTIRRTMLLTSAGNISANLIGRVVRRNGLLVSFPVTVGIMTITTANFYQNGGPLVDAGIPFIDFTYY